MTERLSLPAPAKLNLFLHITGRRSDGYHELQTLFQLLNVGDELTFTATDDGQIYRDYELAGVSAENDIIMRAARLLQQTCRTTHGVRISLQKRLPMGGGLGGGSSNAATTLLGLNRLWDCQLELEELARLGLQLGADVPVFIYGRTAWGEGVGQQLTPVQVPQAWYVVLIPPLHVSTAEVFSDSQLIRDCPPITIRDFLAGRSRNVCEPIVTARHPEIQDAIDALAEFTQASMTGTGACVFGRFDSEAAAQTAWQSLSESWNGFVAEGVGTSPVHTRLNDTAIASE